MILLLVILIGIAFYLFNRQKKVREFRELILDHLVLRSTYGKHERYRVFNKVTEGEMIFSIKPLELESFYTEPEILILVR
jgi:hypothetical protein